MKYTQNQTCALDSSPATAPRAATSGHYFKMATWALSFASVAANSPKQQQHQQQQQQQQQFLRILFEPVNKYAAHSK